MEKEKKHRTSSDEMLNASYEYNEVSYKYDAFISYRHVEPDQTVAKYVLQMIEIFKVPKEFYKDGKSPVFRVFRDREELAARDLGASIEEALTQSRYLVVICSKRTPLSEWCQKEIEIFKGLHGEERIIPVLIEGEPDEAFPNPLKEIKDQGDVHEILAADIRPDEIFGDEFTGYENLQDKHKLNELTKQSIKLLNTEKYRIMATILGCSFGDLKQRDKERKNKRILNLSLSAGAVFLVFGIFMAAYHKAEVARQEAVQSNASILMKTSKDYAGDGDYLKAALVAKEAMNPISKNMKYYNTLKAEEFSIFNSVIYHGGASTLTVIPTKNNMTYMALSNDEKYVAYGLDNNNTAIASVENGEIIKEFEGHSQQVKLLSFSADDKYLASASFDNTCIIYDIETGEQKAVLDIVGIPMMIRFSTDGTKLFYAVLYNDNTVFYVYDAGNFKKQSEFTVEGQVKSADIKKDGSEILITLNTNTDDQVTRRSLKDGSIIDVIPKLSEKNIITQEDSYKPYKSAAYSADGQNILLLTDAEIIKMSFDKQEVFRKDMYINPDDNKVIYESDDGGKIAVKSNTKIYILDGNTGEISDEIYFEKLNLKYYVYNSDTNTVVGFGENGNYSIWKDNAVVEDNLKYGSGTPVEFKFLKDGSKILANSHESQAIKIIDLKSGVSSESIYARIMANSNDSSKMLLFDGKDVLLSSDDGKTSSKINVDESTIDGVAPDSKYYKISNNGRYYATVVTALNSDKPVLKVYDLQENDSKQLEMDSFSSVFTFSNDSEQILLADGKNGLRVFDSNSMEQVKSYSDINDDSGKMILSPDSKVLVFNNISGTASIYNLENGEHIDDVDGEVLDVQNTGDEIKLKGIKNNTAFTWSNKSGLVTWNMDDACRQTPLSFNDVNMYNANTDLLMMIRNNENDRKCYIVDFSSGNVRMTLNSAVKKYTVNGHISPDGKLIAIDQNYYSNYDSKSAKTSYYTEAKVYKMLSEDEVSKEVDNILAGRTLTQDEKIQIGISTK
jgi:possible WD repeat-containing protein